MSQASAGRRATTTRPAVLGRWVERASERRNLRRGEQELRRILNGPPTAHRLELETMLAAARD